MRRALGKGLSQLLADPVTPVETSQVSTLPVSSLVPAIGQPRRHFDPSTLEELANSLREVGMLQPIVCRKISNSKYEIIAGERRWRAAQLAGLEEVPVNIRAASAQLALELAIIENVQREDISAMECAWAYKRLSAEFSLSHEQIADKVGKSRTAVSNTLRLLRLPDYLQTALQDGTISEGHARALVGIESPAKQQALYLRIQSEGLSVRETERLAGEMTVPGTSNATPTPVKPVKRDPQWHALSESFSEFFGSPSKLVKTSKGGKLEIDFYSDEDLQRILDKLGIG